MMDPNKGINSLTERVGGNAGDNSEAINFLYDYNGKIIVFENPQYISKELLKKHKQATFITEIKTNAATFIRDYLKELSKKHHNKNEDDLMNMFYSDLKKGKIKTTRIRLFFDKNNTQPSDTEKTVLMLTKEEYNKRYGWKD
jgi:hypothetical protein